MNTLTISGLNKTYRNGVKAIHNISFEISNGMFGLLGPNGAGKSSLMKTIAGLQKADTGSISLNGENILKNPAFIKKQLGFLPQDFGVYPKISAYDLLNHLAVLKGISHKQQRKEQIMDLLEKVNLYQHRKREVHTFSGGMRQRFGVAQALLGQPRIILVDEPTAGLDPEERNRFNFLLNNISHDIIVMLSTHLVEDVKNLCSSMAVIHNGELLCFGSPALLMEKLAGHIFIRSVAGSELEDYQSRYQVIHHQFSGGHLSVIVYSEAQPPGFQPLEPSLEHFYFYTLHTNHKNKAS